ncbi:hypothetical protein DYU11_20985 [Fibrisoma montanum]|uniref:Uncharacterized protein n=1 Tax=Fibrisoma montanum TaxID=2305895 RepID=A0A418M4D4_9BACT|nr:hypothetical protein [Fibrisoma montanum]RIV20523.1 hypothetical protein DYU11_20985 [Fibrisoma montanum]
MNTIDLYLGNTLKRFTGPSNWSEVTAHQAIGLMRVREQVEGNFSVLFPALQLIYGMKRRDQRWLFDRAFLKRRGYEDEAIVYTVDLGNSLLETLLWVGDIDPAAEFPVPQFRLHDFKFGRPSVWLRHRTVYAGPSAGLGTSTFAEFISAYKAYQDRNWAQLTAVLYRPVNPDALPGHDVRQPFDAYSVEARATRFKQLDPALLSLVQFNFSCTMLLLQRAFKYVFPAEEEPTDQVPTKVRFGKPQKATWLDVAIGMAKLDVTKIEQIEQTNVYLALKVLNEQSRQAAELEAELEKLKKK